MFLMAETKNQLDSIIIGNCLSCQGLVRVPSTAPANSNVRCPHCSQSYRLSQILDQAVPELEVILESEIAPNVPHVDQIRIKTENDDTDGSKKFVVPTQLSEGAKRSRRRRRSESSSSSSSRPATSPKTSSSGRASTSRGSSSQSGSNGILEVVKIGMGGLLAIPIAYLLVFWVFQKDPLHIGPSVSGVVPFLVPAEFHAVDSPEEETEPQTSNVERPTSK